MEVFEIYVDGPVTRAPRTRSSAALRV